MQLLALKELFSIVTPDGNVKILDSQSETDDEIEGDFQYAIDFSLNNEWLLVGYPYSLIQVNGERSIQFPMADDVAFLGERRICTCNKLNAKQSCIQYMGYFNIDNNTEYF